MREWTKEESDGRRKGRKETSREVKNSASVKVS